MYISSVITSGSGIQYELEVWEAFKKTFASQSAFAIHHYPMFYRSGVTRREIDILFVHQQFGLFVIEVKGLQIDQIDKIQGHHWYYRNFREEKGEPYQQAFHQMQMLSKDIEEKLFLKNRLNRFSLVALPLISQADWDARGFSKQLHIPSPILKDDLQDAQSLTVKIMSAIQDTKLRPFDKASWHRLLLYFNLDAGVTMRENVVGEVAQKDVVEKTYRGNTFSRLYVIQTKQQFDEWRTELVQLLSEGIKLYVLSYVPLTEKDLEGLADFQQAFQLNLYTSTKQKQIKAGYFDDGKLDDALLTQLTEDFPLFNKGQYMAIHYDAQNPQQMISAGAGTGKTHVMIDRILYLIVHERVSLKDIIMITFTNASTNEMKARLENKFIKLFDLTNESRYLQYAEEVKDMQISTIHSFAKSILKKLAHEIGYGHNIRLRSFIYEKQRIVRELINEYFKEQPVELFYQSDIRYYEFIKLVTDMWEEMEKKGLSQAEIEGLQWGEANELSRPANVLLRYIFENCEQRLNDIKIEENAITMGDLIRKLKDFTVRPETIKQLNKGCFMFVDEFQDSDDVQIELIAKLQEVLNYQLFVVGDIKQSIYRFRGADYRSFDELEKRKPANVIYQHIPLQHNYRSSKELLNKMHTLFEKWGQQSLLTYAEQDRLLGSAASNYSDNWRIYGYGKNEWHKYVRVALQHCECTKVGDNKKTAIIVRTNSQAKEMKKICDELGILTTENLDGTFFTSLPVQHFKALVQGLLYPNEPKFLLNALETPYFDLHFSYHELVVFEGQKEKITSFIQKRLNGQFQKYVDDLRMYSAMTVIQKIIAEQRLLSRVHQQFITQGLDEEITQLECMKYEHNLQHLMTLIEKNFNHATLSLYNLHEWLSLQMNTNRTENEPSFETDKALVEITTVHRSKGLEYDTVLLPITHKKYDAIVPRFHLEDGGTAKSSLARRFGWQMKKLQNSYFNELMQVESDEQKKEEVRLLYVALTRAEQRVVVLLPNEGAYGNTWAQLLRDAGLRETVRL